MRRPRGPGSKARGRRARGDRGAVLVEAALVVPFLFAVIFGIIDFGFTFNDWISVRQGARDGMRQMIVKPNVAAPGGGTWSCPSVGGPGTGTDAQAVMCYTKARIGLDQNKTRISVWFDPTNGFKAGYPVKICVQYKTSSLTGAYSTILDNKVLDTDVESLIEQDDTNMTAFTETGFQTWPLSCTQV